MSPRRIDIAGRIVTKLLAALLVTVALRCDDAIFDGFSSRDKKFQNLVANALPGNSLCESKLTFDSRWLQCSLERLLALCDPVFDFRQYQLLSSVEPPHHYFAAGLHLPLMNNRDYGWDQSVYPQTLVSFPMKLQLNQCSAKFQSQDNTWRH